jgi:hypothetical protein
MSYNTTTLNPLNKNLISNSNASGLNGGYHCPALAITCHTNQLANNDMYLLGNALLIKGAIANAEYVYNIQLPNPKNISDTNMTAGIIKNPKLLLVR